MVTRPLNPPVNESISRAFVPDEIRFVRRLRALED
jgi:hypothetical protein